MAIPLLFEFAVREWIAASFQSQDSDSLIEGFRQMLKGICDGELLLDGNFQICGRAPCLQRLLSSREDFDGHSFRELIVDDKARKLFDGFLAKGATSSDGEEREEGDERHRLRSVAAPRCLRMPLRAPSGQAVSVDVFHVPLPPRLYGESTTYHLLALKEDVDSMPVPEADPTQNVLPSSLLESRRAPTVRSAASDAAWRTGTYGDASGFGDLGDGLTSGHLARAGCAVEVRMGMPTLKRFARPLDWANLDAVLRRYARKVRKAHGEAQGQQGEEEEQALPSMTLRVPGESRKHLRSRRVAISSPFPRQHTTDDVFLYIHLQSFEEPRVRATLSLASLGEETVGFEGPALSSLGDEDQRPPFPLTVGQEAQVDLEPTRQERGPASEGALRRRPRQQV
eukprot:s5971_g1.t2